MKLARSHDESLPRGEAHRRIQQMMAEVTEQLLSIAAQGRTGFHQGYRGRVAEEL